MPTTDTREWPVSWWVRIRCALRGHPLALTVEGYGDERDGSWCTCGLPRRPDTYRTVDGRTWLAGRGPEPWR